MEPFWKVSFMAGQFWGLSAFMVLVSNLFLLWSLPQAVISATPLNAGSLISTEAQSLFALKQSLAISNASWPTSADPCTTWQGITCEDGYVSAISLVGLNRTSAGLLQPVFAMDGLQGLASLKALNASTFTLLGTIPSWFGNLSSLRILSFSGCFLNGTIPSSLGRLENLQLLSLSHNYLSGTIPTSLSRLSNLTILDLSSNLLYGNFPDEIFANLTKLIILNVSNNFLRGSVPSQVTRLTYLQRFSLSSNGFSGSIPSQLGNLTMLSDIDLSNNNFTGGIPPELGNLTELSSLKLSSNFLNGSFPVELTSCSKLEVLHVGENFFEGDFPLLISSWMNLSSFNISVNTFTGLLPSGLSHMMQLRDLDLSHNLLYGPLSELANLTELLTLDASYNFFNGSPPTGLLPTTVLKKNCLDSVQGQHTVRACNKFYSQRGLTRGIAQPPSVPSPISTSPTATPVGRSPAVSASTTSGRRKRNRHLIPIVAGVGGGLGSILIVVAIAICLHRCEKGTGALRKDGGIGTEGGAVYRTGVPGMIASRLGEVFTYTQLQNATKKFSATNLISSGHSGDLYKGTLEGGGIIVVKRMDGTRFKKDSYVPELEVYGKASNARLVPLLGYCLDREDEKLLVYKFMPNGDLASALHTKGSPGPGDVLRSLDWITRLKVAIGAAEALAFLHQECNPPLVHRDVRATSILLDDKFEVRLGSLSDVRSQDGDSHPGLIRRLLGLSQSSDQGDSGELHRVRVLLSSGSSVASCAHDVYNYGKVLLELVSGKLGISGAADPRTDAWLDWAVPLIDVHDKESLPKLVDPSLIVDEDLLEEVWAVAIIAKACLNPKPSKRPSMRHVLKALENPHKVVRQDFNFTESLAARTSSHSSWNEALFGSWRHNSTVIPGSLREEYSGKGPSAMGLSQVSNARPDYSQSFHARRGSSDIVPEPIDEEVPSIS